MPLKICNITVIPPYRGKKQLAFTCACHGHTLYELYLESNENSIPPHVWEHMCTFSDLEKTSMVIGHTYYVYDISTGKTYEITRKS